MRMKFKYLRVGILCMLLAACQFNSYVVRSNDLINQENHMKQENENFLIDSRKLSEIESLSYDAVQSIDFYSIYGLQTFKPSFSAEKIKLKVGVGIGNDGSYAHYKVEEDKKDFLRKISSIRIKENVNPDFSYMNRVLIEVKYDKKTIHLLMHYPEYGSDFVEGTLEELSNVDMSVNKKRYVKFYSKDVEGIFRMLDKDFSF